MGEAEQDRCASSTSKSEAPQTLIPCMRAAAPLQASPDCEEKRDPRSDCPAETINLKLDPATRLEKRSLACLQQADVREADVEVRFAVRRQGALSTHVGLKLEARSGRLAVVVVVSAHGDCNAGVQPDRPPE